MENKCIRNMEGAKDMNIKEMITRLTFEEKTVLLTGGGALKTEENKRLGIPKLEMSDGPHGIRRLLKHPNPIHEQECNIRGGDVCFPTASAMGCTWNKELIYETGQAIAADCKEEGVQMLLAPGVNMKRTPLCGRNFEYFSEDPILSGELGAEFIKGVQTAGVATSLKHFAVNNQEIERSSISVEVDERTLREYYLKPFEIALKKGMPKSVMCAYNKLGGIWCSENQWLLKDLLREEWGYDGLVVSDWHAVHSPAKALAAGLELQMPKNEKITECLKDGIEKRIITEEDIDAALERYLNFLFDILKDSVKQKPYDRKEQHEIAKKGALEAITLLKNENDILPILPLKYKKIAIFGTFAEETVIQGGGSSRVTVEKESIETPIDFIRQYATSDMEIIYESLYDKVTLGMEMFRTIQRTTKDIDLAIVFAANEQEYETEGIDRNKLTFSDYINDCINEINKYCPNTVVVMQTGACTAPRGWKDSVKGLIQMGYVGEAGGSAIAEILYGIENPCGKLSETFITSVRSDLDYPGDGRKVWYREGMFVGYRYYDKNPEHVWFPFGHGLSYTRFQYSDLVITPENSNTSKQKVIVKCKVKNIGDRSGKEIVQLYLKQNDGIAMKPEKELKAFDKVLLQAGEEKVITFILDTEAFSYYNTYLKSWHVESGEYQILVGASATDLRLAANYHILWDEDYTIDLKHKAVIL
jgi:beta-glucosidase